MGVLAGKTIVLGVSGGIAAYKSAELVRLLVTSGANVRVMMTRNATEFISPLTLRTLSSNPVATDTFSLTQESQIGHIKLARSARAVRAHPGTAGRPHQAGRQRRRDRDRARHRRCDREGQCRNRRRLFDHGA